MSTILNRLRASGGSEYILPTLEIKLKNQGSIYLCNGFDDCEIGIDNETVTATATGMQIALPKKDSTGSQSLRFAIANVIEDAHDIIKNAVDNQEKIELIYREYTSDDFTTPAQILNMIVDSITLQGDTIDITARFFDLIDTQFPRDIYTPEFAPGLKHIN